MGEKCLCKNLLGLLSLQKLAMQYLSNGDRPLVKINHID